MTQRSDMELKLAEFGFELLTLHDKYPAYETATEEYRAKYEAEESHLISLYAKAIEAHEQRSIDRALETLRQNLEPDLFGHDYERLVDEINNLSPTTTEDKEERDERL